MTAPLPSGLLGSLVLEGMAQKKGFTNMAQAFTLAETMCTVAGRKGSQLALLVITDEIEKVQGAMVMNQTIINDAETMEAKVMRIGDDAT